MTFYYYLASDQKMGLGNGAIDFIETDITIPGFDFPVQLETFSLEKEWECRVLLQYIHRHTEPYNICTVQIAHLLNSNRVKLEVKEKSKILLHEIKTPNRLLIEEGHLLTIKKVPTFN